MRERRGGVVIGAREAQQRSERNTYGTLAAPDRTPPLSAYLLKEHMFSSHFLREPAWETRMGGSGRETERRHHHGQRAARDDGGNTRRPRGARPGNGHRH